MKSTKHDSQKDKQINEYKKHDEEHSKHRTKKSSGEKKELKKIEAKLEETLEKLSQLEKDNQELKDSLLRKVAEFENYKRRTEKDQLNFLEYAAESFIIKILPIYDDLNRSIEHLDEAKDIDSIKQGLKLVLEKFKKTLEDQGIKKIEAKDKEFDFNYHEALMQQNSDDVPPNTVLQEVEPGYMYKDKVIRHSKVIVSQDNEEQSKTVSSEKEDENSN